MVVKFKDIEILLVLKSEACTKYCLLQLGGDTNGALLDAA